MTWQQSRLRRIWIGAALFWFHVCLALAVSVGLLNGAALLLAEDAELAVHPPAYVREAMARAFPELSPEERLALRREHAIRFVDDPLVLFRELPRTGRFVSVDPRGFRLGADQGPWPPSPEYFNVFMLGGSTTFGYGVPDEDTIASYLQPMLGSGDGREARVYNFGRGAYDSGMERLLFQKLVLMGIPMDLVIFLDGVNDFVDSIHPILVSRAMTRLGEQRVDAPVRAVLRELPMARLFAPDPLHQALIQELELDDPQAGERPADGTDGGNAEPIRAVIDRYLTNTLVIEAIASDRDIEVLFAWQPAATYKSDASLHPYRKNRLGVGQRIREGYTELRAHLDANPPGASFLWCADIQEGVKELLYVDRFHYTPRMSERVAACIAEGLAQRGDPEAG